MSKIQELVNRLADEELEYLHNLGWKDEEFQAIADWELANRRLSLNPIVIAYMGHVTDVAYGETDPEDGLSTAEDVLALWIHYMAEGDQEVSWYPPVLAQANEFFRRTAERFNVEYREGMTQAHG